MRTGDIVDSGPDPDYEYEIHPLPEAPKKVRLSDYEHELSDARVVSGAALMFTNLAATRPRDGLTDSCVEIAVTLSDISQRMVIRAERRRHDAQKKEIS